MPILSPDEISTIFVVGFPPDIKEREFQNLFMFASGFEGASLKLPEPVIADMTKSFFDDQDDLNKIPQYQVYKQQIIGFARFQRRQDALAARDHLNGRCIDQEKGCVLKVEMAKKNLFIAPKRCSIPTFCFPTNDERLDESDDLLIPIVKKTRSLSLSIPGNPDPIDISLPNALLSKNISMDSSRAPPEIIKPSFINSGPRSYSLASSTSTPAPMYVFGENPPCNTLYVGNLPLNVDEEELRALFEDCEGFKRMSFKTKANGPMCFIEFEDINCARRTMDTLYGTLLSSSTKGGIRLSFSKNPLGVRSATPMGPISPALSLMSKVQPMPQHQRTSQHLPVENGFDNHSSNSGLDYVI